MKNDDKDVINLFEYKILKDSLKNGNYLNHEDAQVLVEKIKQMAKLTGAKNEKI